MTNEEHPFCEDCGLALRNNTLVLFRTFKIISCYFVFFLFSVSNKQTRLNVAESCILLRVVSVYLS